MGQVFRKSTTRGEWNAVIAEATDLARWAADTPVYHYRESVDECAIDAPQAVATVQPAALAFEGRLFNPTAEVRWLGHDDGTFQAWVVREGAPDDKEHLAEFSGPKEQKYYLLGLGDAALGVFREARFPAKEFTYP